MSVIIRLQGLPWTANALDIRHYFQGLNIPEGGVHIVGGDDGDAFIAFASDEDARQAMMIEGKRLKDNKIKLLLSSKAEMQKVIEIARNQSVALLAGNVKTPESANRRERSRERSRERRGRDKDRERDRRSERERDGRSRGSDSERSRDRSYGHDENLSAQADRGRRHDKSPHHSYDAGRDKGRDSNNPWPDNEAGPTSSRQHDSFDNSSNQNFFPEQTRFDRTASNPISERQPLIPSIGSDRLKLPDIPSAPLPPPLMNFENQLHAPEMAKREPNRGMNFTMQDQQNPLFHHEPPSEYHNFPNRQINKPPEFSRENSRMPGFPGDQSRTNDLIRGNEFRDGPMRGPEFVREPVRGYDVPRDMASRGPNLMKEQPQRNDFVQESQMRNQELNREQPLGRNQEFNREQPLGRNQEFNREQVSRNPEFNREQSSTRGQDFNRGEQPPIRGQDFNRGDQLPMQGQDFNREQSLMRGQDFNREEQPPIRGQDFNRGKQIPMRGQDFSRGDLPLIRGPDFNRGDQPPMRGQDFNRGEQQPMRGNDFNRAEQPSGRGSDFNRGDQPPGRGYDFNREQLSRGNNFNRDQQPGRDFDFNRDQPLMRGPEFTREVLHRGPELGREAQGRNFEFNRNPEFANRERSHEFQGRGEPNLRRGPEMGNRDIRPPDFPFNRESHREVVLKNSEFSTREVSLKLQEFPLRKEPLLRDPPPPPDFGHQNENRDGPYEPWRNAGRNRPGNGLMNRPDNFVEMRMNREEQGPPMMFRRGPDGPQARKRFGEMGFREEFSNRMEDRQRPGEFLGEVAPSKRRKVSIFIEIKGMPFSVNYRDVREFFRGLRIPHDGLKLINDEFGNRVGTGFVKFLTENDAQEALRKNKEYMGNRCVDVQVCSEMDFETVIDSYVPPVKPPSKFDHRNDRTYTNVILIKGLPYNCDKRDIEKLFEKINITDIVIENDVAGKMTGNCFVEFESNQDAKFALSQTLKIRHKFLTLISSNKDQMMAIKNRNTAPKKDSSKSESKEKIESNEGINKNVSDSKHWVQLSGIPFTTTPSDIKKFFTGLEIIPGSTFIPRTNKGLITGDAFVEFANPKDAEKALDKNKAYMGTRYIFVRSSTSQEVAGARKRNESASNMQQPAQGDHGKLACTICIQNIPFRSTVPEVANFFRGYNQDFIEIQYNEKNQPLGEAVVGFRNSQDAQKAIKELNNKQIGRRTVSLYMI